MFVQLDIENNHNFVQDIENNHKFVEDSVNTEDCCRSELGIGNLNSKHPNFDLEELSNSEKKDIIG